MSAALPGRRALLANGLTLGLSLAALHTRPARAATVLRWASVLAATHPTVQMMERIARQVRDETAGAVEIQIFPAGQLGSSRDAIEAVSAGAIQIVDEGAAQFGQFVPPMSILEAPYIWRDAVHMRRALASPLLEEMNTPLVARRGMRIIGATYYGKRHITSGTRPLRSVADLKGFKLRIPEVDTFRAMAEAWGARPTPLNINELYLALSQGAVDGQENPLPTIQSAKLNEVQKFLILSGHVITPRLVAIHEEAWRGLNARARDALRQALASQGEWQDKAFMEQEGSLLESFRAGGMTIVEPDLEEFRKPVLAALPAKFEAKWGKGLWDRVAAL
ncbi:sialic acid TRAP transporter substrate-binding protein SiaP [Roseomonas sp. GC11]|uniref:sialic acid TRAP transporter substrate-binding protein SiaP n=1 Tax=Roseomonas sp. GC11 TaxID=2950546 RepID=UPI00210DE54D|nr:sialic acid TRAP transporter substrate-binding protein SiaP [Roseomonas sp. GC11]MCQ4161562.1 sialic acid TRAP transporter substrate-binding protein SiaP [Roseomonas sp. GC11]